MPLVIAILAAIAIAGASLFGLGPTGKKLIEPIGPPGYAGPVCLNEQSITDEVVLSQFPKATQDNTPFPNSDRCSGGGCQGPDLEDYVKITGAESVVVSEIMPHEPTTRLYKQTLPPDAKYDPYRDMVYRASCNDWCLLGLPYGGSFHCDFIFLLKDRADLITRPIDGQDQLYPKDCDDPDDPATCSVFEVLFRKSAEIPEKLKCNGQNPPTSQNFIDKVFAQTETFIYVGGESYILAEEEPITLVKIDMRSQAQGRTKVADSVSFRGETYEAYKNLTNKIDLTNEFLYLVEPGKVAEADQSADQFFKFDYLEFRKTPPKRPGAKTLQLGTFPVATGKGWWRKWVDESKPAIYLYPEEPTKLRVILNPTGRLTRSAPPYNPNRGWEVLAYPDGTIRHLGSEAEEADSPGVGFDSPGVDASESSYPYLFYEAKLEQVFIKPEGFIVQGKDLVSFFKKTLPKLGLNSQETQDFIDYWMTRLSENQPYYFIHFLDEEQIESLEPLTFETINAETIPADKEDKETSIDKKQHVLFFVQTQPDTEIRIRAYFKPLDHNQPLNISPQNLPAPPKRKGFTLVEWGGILDSPTPGVG